MISNNNGALTEDEIAAYNAAIESFIKRNTNYVDLSDRDDGFTYITLRYGPVRDAALKEIATRCKNSLIDDVFKIGVLDCTISYANGSILRFKGRTSEILEGMKQLDSSSYGGLIDKSKANVELPENFAQNVATIVKKYTVGRKDFTDSIKKNEGLNFYQSGNKDHFGVDLNVLAKHVNTAASPREDAVTLNTVCQTIIAKYQENSKIITETLATQLSQLFIQLERVNANIILFAYDIIGETAAGGSSSSSGSSSSGGGSVTPNPADEFTYTKTPGTINKIIVHFGNASANDLAKSNFTSATVDLAEEEQCTVLTDTDGAVVAVAKDEDIANIVSYYKKVSTSSKVLVTLAEPLTANTDTPISYHLSNAILTSDNESLITFIKNVVRDENSNISVEDVTEEDMRSYVNEHAYIGSSDGVLLINTTEANGSGIGLFGDSVLGLTQIAVTSSNIVERYAVEEGEEPVYDTYSTISYNGNVVLAALATGRAIDVYLV